MSQSPREGNEPPCLCLPFHLSCTMSCSSPRCWPSCSLMTLVPSLCLFLPRACLSAPRHERSLHWSSMHEGQGKLERPGIRRSHTEECGAVEQTKPKWENRDRNKWSCCGWAAAVVAGLQLYSWAADVCLGCSSVAGRQLCAHLCAWATGMRRV